MTTLNFCRCNSCPLHQTGRKGRPAMTTPLQILTDYITTLKVVTILEESKITPTVNVVANP